MIIYGVNPILEAIRSHPERIRYVGVAREETARHQRLMGEAKRAGVAVRNLALDQIDRLAGRGVHNGVVAEVSETAYADFDEIVEKEETNFVLIVDSITDPQNFGAILRVADGFGVDVVVIPEHDSVGLTPVAVKASAGASEWVQVAQVTNLSRAIETLKKSGYWIYAAAENGERPDAIDFTGKVALVVGNEGKGIRRNVLEHCDRTVTIPMSGHVGSFNVATATAILCYEVRRQQR
ncbi:MAG: 23S rRNA (guanosine(2251)-2'-O)-methyltransferase RlmB [Acidobacteria bacterium]|nr:23S rRNA (guanosine(2251)-2'-O)-methyltransferase RlmB [Acidobacteriota bacterium]MBV9068288.1 23S rRNA (guanosine(2251)-2'-O)-methyltransferase RlmB [Acidobacteriota bacterium]MBV9184469.1 23S rRNA (guanosine(2251)-2'-O)-methyltransferase RlmB [Acidobacteriota bacterium]